MTTVSMGTSPVDHARPPQRPRNTCTCPRLRDDGRVKADQLSLQAGRSGGMLVMPGLAGSLIKDLSPMCRDTAYSRLVLDLLGRTRVSPYR
jgi:hypothetical protein